MALLDIADLSVDFPTRQGVLHAVDGVSLSLEAGEVLGIVGESGSGKSVAMMALMGLVPFPGTCALSACASTATTCWTCRRASATGSSARTWR